MQKHIYNIRYKIDKTEWRIRVKRDLVYSMYRKWSLLDSKQKYLDFGCGTGVLLEEMEQKFPNIESYGIDVEKSAIDYCKKRGLIRASVYRGKTIPFKNNTFHLVTAIDVIEHIKDDMYALKELKRIMKKNAVGIFLVPAHMHLWSTRDIRLYHYRRYEDNELEDKCREAGFTVLESKNVDFMLYFALLLMCKNAKKKKGIPHLAMDDVQSPFLLNETMYIYEKFENFLLKFINYPIGITKLVVVKK